MKKKSWSWPLCGSRWGGRPPLISWAAVVIIDLAAWRKIWVSLTTGAIPEAIRSSKGLPAPIGGSWSASPTKTTWVDSASPSSSTRIRRRLSIEDSSTITRSAGSGWPGLKAGSRPGIHSSMRWIVCASCPVASSRRRAARPVGAQSAIRGVRPGGLARRSPACRPSCRRRGRRSGSRSARRRRPAPPPTARR